MLTQAETYISDVPERTPVVDVHSVGAHGSSIAYIDAGGTLRVGPESAGADPGPACHGRGGPATVTDANLVLGRILPDRFLGGRMALRQGDAICALVSTTSATGFDLYQTVQGILRVANANMERALRVLSVERGTIPGSSLWWPSAVLARCTPATWRPRYAFPASSCPFTLACFRSWAWLWLPPPRNFSQAIMATVPPQPGEAWDSLRRHLDNTAHALWEKGQREMAQKGFGTAFEAYYTLDLRYQGQAYELTVPVKELSPAHFLPLFHSRHEERFGYAGTASLVEVVNLRLRLAAPAPPIALAPLLGGSSDASPALVDEREVWFHRPLRTAIYDRDRLKAGNHLAGPAVVAQMDATTLIPPGWQGTVDMYGNLVLEPADEAIGSQQSRGPL